MLMPPQQWESGGVKWWPEIADGSKQSWINVKWGPHPIQPRSLQPAWGHPCRTPSRIPPPKPSPSNPPPPPSPRSFRSKEILQSGSPAALTGRWAVCHSEHETAEGLKPNLPVFWWALYNFLCATDAFDVFGKFSSSVPPPVILPGLLCNAEEGKKKKALVLGIINNLMQQV